ncbi:MAG: dihydroorotate dehydrogenase electron transfer subunit [Candidatus Omnitrophota bacterium]
MARKKKVLKAKIISNRKIAPDHYETELDAPYLGANSSPGQFVSVKIQDEGTDPLLRIPLGVHQKTKKGINLLYKVVGPGTRLLSLRKKGEVISVLGPLGNGFDLGPLLKKKNARAILVAGGHGVAPLYALAKAITKEKRPITVFIGACEAKHIVSAGKFRKLKAKVKTAAEKGECACVGYITEPLKEYLRKNKEQAKNSFIYACGPRPMLATVASEAKKSNIPAQVSLDAYMACGIGTCLGCAIETTAGYKLVCKDGPVFDAQEIKWKYVC